MNNFPVAGVAVFGSFAVVWWRPAGVTAPQVWLNTGLSVLTYAMAAACGARWQAQTHFAKLPDGTLNPMYLRSMSTHWVSGSLITLSRLIGFWMAVQHLASKIQKMP